MSKQPSLLDIEDILCNSLNPQNRQTQFTLLHEHLGQRVSDLSKISSAISNVRSAADPLPKAVVEYLDQIAISSGPVNQVDPLLRRYATTAEKAKQETLEKDITQAIKVAVPNVILVISIIELLEIFLSFFYVKDTKEVRPREDDKFRRLKIELDRQIDPLVKLITPDVKASASPTSPKLVRPMSPSSSRSRSPSMVRSNSFAVQSPSPSFKMSHSNALAVSKTGYVSGSFISSPSVIQSSVSVEVKEDEPVSEGPDLNLIVMLPQARLQRTRAQIALYNAADRPVPEDVVLAEQQYDFENQIYEKSQFVESASLAPLPNLLKNFRKLKEEIREAKSPSAEQQQRLYTAEFKILSARSTLSQTRYKQQSDVVEEITSIVPTFFGISEAEKTRRLSAASATLYQLGQEKCKLERQVLLFREQILQSQQENIRSSEALSCEIASLSKLLGESAEAKEKNEPWRKDIEEKSGQRAALQKRIDDALLITDPSENPCSLDNARIAAWPPERSRLKYLGESLKKNMHGSFTEAQRLEASVNQLRRRLARLCLRLVSGALLQMAQRNLKLTQTKPDDFNKFVDWFTVVTLIPNFNQMLQPLWETLRSATQNLSQLVEKSDSLTDLLRKEADALEKSLSESCKASEHDLVHKLLPSLQKQEKFLNDLTKTIDYACQQQETMVSKQDPEVIANVSAELKIRTDAYDSKLDEISKQATRHTDEAAAIIEFKSGYNKKHVVTDELKFFITQGVYSFASPQQQVTGATSVSSASSAGVQDFSNYCQGLLTGPSKHLANLLVEMQDEKNPLKKVLASPAVTLATPHFKDYRQFFLEDTYRVRREILDLEIEKKFMENLRFFADFFPILYEALGFGAHPLVVDTCKQRTLNFIKDLQSKPAEVSFEPPPATGAFVDSLNRRQKQEPSPDEKLRAATALREKELKAELKKPLEHRMTVYSQKLLTNLQRLLTTPTPEEQEREAKHSPLFLKELFSDLLKIKLLELLVLFIEFRKHFLSEQPLGFKGPSKQAAETFERLLSDYILTQITESHLNRCVKWLRNLIMSPKLLDLGRVKAFRERYLRNEAEIENQRRELYQKIERGYSFRLYCAYSATKSKNFKTPADAINDFIANSHIFPRQLSDREFSENSTIWLYYSAILIRGDIQLQLSDEIARQLKQEEEAKNQAEEKIQAYRLEQKQIGWKLGTPVSPYSLPESGSPLANVLSFCSLSQRYVAAQKLQALTAGWRKVKSSMDTILPIKAQGYLAVFVNQKKDLPLDWKQGKDKKIYIYSASGVFKFNYVINWDGTPVVREFEGRPAEVSNAYGLVGAELPQKKSKISSGLDLTGMIIENEKILAPQDRDMTQALAHLSEEEQFQYSMLLLQKAEQEIKEPLKEVAALLAEPQVSEPQPSIGELELKAFRPLFTEISPTETRLADTFLSEAVAEFRSTFYPVYNSYDKLHSLFCKYRKLCVDEQLLLGLIDEAGKKTQESALISRFAVETHKKWIEPIIELAALWHGQKKTDIRDQQLRALTRLLKGIMDGEVDLRTELELKDSKLADADSAKRIMPKVDNLLGKLLPDQPYEPVVTLLFSNLRRVPEASHGLDDLKGFAETKWVKRLAAIENLHSLVTELKESKESKEPNTTPNMKVVPDLLGRLEKLHTDLITVWRRKIVESPMEKAKKGEELQMHLQGSTLHLLEDVLGPDGMGKLDSMGVLKFDFYEGIAPHIFTLWSWKFEESYRASYQALFYDFLRKSEYDIDLIEYDSIYAAAKDKEWLHRVDLVKLANTDAKTTDPQALALRRDVAKSIAPHDLDNFLAKKKIRLQIAELLTILGMLRTEQAGFLQWLDEVDMEELAHPSPQPKLAVKHPEWLEEDQQKNIHRNTRLYIVNPKLVKLRTKPAEFNKELRAKVAGVGLLEYEMIEFLIFKKTIQPTSLVWVDEIDQSRLESKDVFALKNPAAVLRSNLLVFFPDLKGYADINHAELFNGKLKEELQKVGLFDSKGVKSNSTRSDTNTTKKDLTDLSKMISALQALVDLHPSKQARLIKELISSENPRLRDFIRWLQEIVNRSDPHKLLQQLIAVQHHQQDILVRFKKIVGAEIKSDQRSVINAFRYWESSIQKSAKTFSSILSQPGFAVAQGRASVGEAIKDKLKLDDSPDSKRESSATPSPSYSPSSSPRDPDLLSLSLTIDVGTPPRTTPKGKGAGKKKESSKLRIEEKKAVPPSPVTVSLSQTLFRPSPPPHVTSIDPAILKIAETCGPLRGLMDKFKQLEDTKETKSESLTAPRFQGSTPAQLRMEFVGKWQDHHQERVRLLEEVRALTKEITDLQQNIETNKLPQDIQAQRINAAITAIRIEIEAKDQTLRALIQEYESKQSNRAQAESRLQTLQMQMQSSVSRTTMRSRDDVEAELKKKKARLSNLNNRAPTWVVFSGEVRALQAEFDALASQQQGQPVADVKALELEIKQQRETISECDRELKNQLTVIANQARDRTRLVQDQKQLRRFLQTEGYPDSFDKLPKIKLPDGTPKLPAQQLEESPEVRRDKRLKEIADQLRADLPGPLAAKNQLLNTRLNRLHELEVWVLTPVIRAAVNDLADKTSAIEKQDPTAAEAKQWMAQSRRLADWLNAQPQIPKEFDPKSVPVMDVKMHPVPMLAPETIKNNDARDRYKKLMQDGQGILGLQAGLKESVIKLQKFIAADSETRRRNNLTSQSPLEITLEFEKLCSKCELWNRKASIVMEQVEGYVFNSQEYARVLQEQQFDNETKVPQTLVSTVETAGVDLSTLIQEDKEIKAGYVKLVTRYNALQKFVKARERELEQLEKNQLPPVDSQPRPDKESHLLDEFKKLLSQRAAWKTSLIPLSLRHSQNPQAVLVGAAMPDGQTVVPAGGLSIQVSENYFNHSK